MTVAIAGKSCHLVVAVDLVQVVHQLLQARQVAFLRGAVPPAGQEVVEVALPPPPEDELVRC